MVVKLTYQPFFLLLQSQPTRHSKFQEGIIITLRNHFLFLHFFHSFSSQKTKFAIGSMGGRMRLLFLVVLSVMWGLDAREFANHGGWNIIAAKSGSSELTKIPDVCGLCEEYTSIALNYLNEENTQKQIIDILHSTCHKAHSFEKKCIGLVDYYATIFFSEIASVQPGDLCNKVNLCQSIANISLLVKENSYEFCKDTVSELLAKLSNPDTELEIIKTLLKVCKSVDNKYANKCKRLVLEFGPLVFANAEKFLETTDVCTALHVSNKAPTVLESFLSYLLSLYLGNHLFRVVHLLKVALY